MGVPLPKARVNRADTLVSARGEALSKQLSVLQHNMAKLGVSPPAGPASPPPWRESDCEASPKRARVTKLGR
eukprot:7286672-Pyramimonas_sp.AAC.1